jgi:hypothetical protein
MSSTTESQIKYAGDGVQVLFTFPFTYLQSTDIYVSLYNETERRWDDTTEWTFANATTIQFATAPPASTGEVTDNIRIQRRTSIDPLVAQFNPGSAIRANDLNDNFEQLQLGIIDNSSAVNNLDVGVTSLTTAGDGLSVDQNTGNIIISNTGVTKITSGAGISIDQSTGSVTITNTKETPEDVVTSVNGQIGDVSLDINALTDVDTSSPGHVPTDGQALVWDANMNHWMPGTVESAGGIPEAPEDNKVYGRENAEWVVVADGETGPVLSVNNQTGVVSIGVEELANFEEYPEGGTRPVSEAYPTYVPDGAPGGLQLTEWAYQNPGNGTSTVILCTTANVWAKYLDDIQVGDTVTFQYQKSTLNGPQSATESGTVLARSVNNQNYFYLTTTALLQNHLPEALIFTHNVPTSGEKYPTTDLYPTFVPDIGEGFTSISQWSFQSDQPGRAYAILCGSTEVLDGYRNSIEVNDSVTFQYTITNIINGEPNPVTETHPVLSFDQVTPGDGSLPYVRIETQCTFQALNSSYPLYFTHSAFAAGGTPDGHVLQWNATDNKWTPGTNTVEQLADFAYGEEPIKTGQALIYNQTTETWSPENVSLNIGLLPTLP